MAWNRSSEVGSPCPPRRGGTPRPTVAIRGTIAGVIVILGAAVAAWWLWPSSENKGETPPHRKEGLIKKAKPAVAKHGETPRLREEAKPAVAPTEEEILLKGRDTNKWIVVTNPHTGKKFVSRYVRPGRIFPDPLYTNGSLNILDALIFTDTSDPMFGVQINKAFMDELQQALIEKIEISTDDSPEIRERKESMKELLDDFRKRLKEGEDLAATIQDALRQRRNLCAFKEMIVETRNEMRMSGASEEEIAEFERACNKKLEDQGASPVLTMELFLKAAEEHRQSMEGR